MVIESMEAFGKKDTEDNYLRVNKLIDGNTYSKVAYVTNTSSGMTKLDSGFYTFYVKDCCGIVIPARLFNVKSFINSGYTVKYLLHKPVLIDFTAQVYKGRWSLLIDSIKPWDGDFDLELFKGKLTVPMQRLEKLQEVTNVSLALTEWECTSVPEIYDGNVGSFAVMANAVLGHLQAYKAIPAIDFGILMRTTAHTLQSLFTKYKKTAVFPFVTNTAMMEELTFIKHCTSDEEQEYVLDSCMEVLGLAKAKMIYGIIINNTIKSVINELNLCKALTVMPTGSSTWVSGVNTELIKC